MKRILVAMATLCASAVPALAVLDTTTGSAIDLAPLLNPLIQLVGGIVAASAGTVAIFAINWVRGKLKLQKLENEAATQSKIDDLAQKIIAGAMARANLMPGQTVIQIKDAVVADAGNRLIGALGKELKALGVSDIPQRAKEIVENRLGMMAAAQAGTPVPGPTATPLPAAVPQPMQQQQPIAPVAAVDPKTPVTQ